MTTAIDQASSKQDGWEYMHALDAFAEANGFLADTETLIDTDSLMAAFESQGVLPMEEESPGSLF